MAEVAEISPILEAIGQLKTGGLILVGTLAVLALVAWGLWLRSKRIEKAADMAAAAKENAAKEKRADRYTAALDGLRTEVEGLRKDTGKGTQAIQAAVGQLEAGHTKRQGELSALMRELLDRQKGVINFEDSLRIIELNFRLEVKSTILALVRDSIRNNHFDEDPGFVRERFLSQANQLLFSAHESLKFYSLSIAPSVFFPSDDAKHYILADEIWKVLETIHSIPEDVADAAVMTKRVQQAQMRAENIVNSFLNSTISKLRGGTEEVPDSGARPPTGNRFRTPLPG